MDTSILGLFAYVDRLLAAAERLRGAGYAVTVLSPIPLVHEMEHAFGEKKSYLKYMTLFGALAGLFGGIIVTLGTAALYPLARGGRPIFSFSPTAIIFYETTILLGVIFTLLGFFLLARIPGFLSPVIPYFRPKVDAPEIATDSFGLLVEDVTEAEFGEIERILKEHGAREVKKVEND